MKTYLLPLLLALPGLCLAQSRFCVVDPSDPVCFCEVFPTDPLCDVPVVLVSFNVSLIGNTPLLVWEVATEQDNDHFTIDRSQEGKVWLELKQIQGAGTSLMSKTYQYKDHSEGLKGLYYYRLSQTDFDGTSENLGVKAIKVNQTTEKYFDLNGRNVPPETKGVLIVVNGDQKTKVFKQ